MQPTSPGGRNETSTDDAFNVFYAHGPGSGSRRASQRASAGTKPGASARTKPGASAGPNPGAVPSLELLLPRQRIDPVLTDREAGPASARPCRADGTGAPRRRSPRPRRTQHHLSGPAHRAGPESGPQPARIISAGPVCCSTLGTVAGEPVGQQDRVDPGVGVGLGGVEVVQVDEDLPGGDGEVAAGARSGSVLPPGLLNSASNATQR